MQLYSSGLTHYPASSRKLVIAVTVSGGSKSTIEDPSFANDTTVEDRTGNMPAFVCYDAAASARPHFFTSTAEIFITQPGATESSVFAHVLKQGGLDALGSPTDSDFDKKPQINDFFRRSNCKLHVFKENQDRCENGSLIENISGSSSCRVCEQEPAACISSNAQEGSSERVVSKCDGDDSLLKDHVRLEHPQMDKYEYEGEEEPVFELQILQEPPVANSRAGLDEKVSLYLAEVDKQNKYLQDKKKFRFHIIPDGNCLYRAVSKAAYGDQSMHAELREQTVHHIADHLQEFSPIIEGDVGVFLIGAAQDGAWAGYPELLAMSQLLNVNIYLTTGGSLESPTVSTMVHYLGEEDLTKPAVWLSWLSNGHYDVLLDRCLPNPEYDNWCHHTQVQRKRDEELAKTMAASLSKMYIKQNGLH